MKACENFVCILIACALGTFATALERNETSITTSNSSLESDKEAFDMITALMLTAIAEEHANITINDQTLRNVSETSSTPLQDSFGNGFDNSDITDTSNIQGVSIDPIISNEFSEETVCEDPQSLAEDKKIIENVLLGMRALPDNATIWELFQAQVQADFAPILIIIPRPVKRLIASNAVKIAQKLRTILGGPMIPMFLTAGRVLRVAGKSIVFIGEDVLRLSNFILTTWDGNVSPVDPFSLQQNKIDDLNSTEVDFNKGTVTTADINYHSRGATVDSTTEGTYDFIELDTTSDQEKAIADSHLILKPLRSDDNPDPGIASVVSDAISVPEYDNGFDDADLIDL